MENRSDGPSANLTMPSFCGLIWDPKINTVSSGHFPWPTQTHSSQAQRDTRTLSGLTWNEMELSTKRV